jgi:hypothetical protein
LFLLPSSPGNRRSRVTCSLVSSRFQGQLRQAE